MAVLVDTSILVDHLRGRREARDLLAAELERGEPLYASEVCRAEILAGVRRGEERATHNLLGALVWVDVTDQIAERGGVLAAQHAGRASVRVADCLIAATRDELDVPLLTTSVERYPMLSGLTPAY